MTIQLAVLGNSHVSALVLAWNQIKDAYPEFDITFFAAPGKNYRRLQINDKKEFGILDGSLFAPDEINLLKATFGASKIALDGFDAVLKVGHDTLETELAGLISAFTIDELRVSPGQPHMSQSAYETLTDGLAETAILPDSWHAWDTPRVFMLPAPRISESCEASKKGVYAAWAKILIRAEKYPAKHLFDAYVEKLRAKSFDAGIEMLMPPADVLAPNGLTKAQYAAGAVTLNTLNPYPETDHKHMNIDYGTEVLRHILPTIEANFVPIETADLQDVE